MSSSGKLQRSLTILFAITDSNQLPTPPAGVTEMQPSANKMRQRANLAGYSQSRAVFAPGTPAGPAGMTCNVQFTTDLTGAAGWTDLTGTVPFDVAGNLTGVMEASAFSAIPPAAQTDVLLRYVTTGGNGVITPQIRSLGLELR